MDAKNEDVDEKEEALSSDLVDAVYEYLMKKEYPKDCIRGHKKATRDKEKGRKV